MQSKKLIEPGTIVIYKNQEDKSKEIAVITHITGNKSKRYYRVGQNGLGMIMDYIDSQLLVKGLKQNVIKTYNSINDIMKETDKLKQIAVLEELIYYLSYLDERDETLSKVFKNKGFTAENLKKAYLSSQKEDKKLFIKSTYTNLLSEEERNDLLLNIKSEEELATFVLNTSNRKNYFNSKAKDIIEEKLKTLVKSNKIKSSIITRMTIISERYIIENTMEVIKNLKNFNEFSDKNKSLFIKQIPIILGRVERSNNEEYIQKVKTISKELLKNTDFKSFILNNKTKYIKDLLSNNKFELGYHFPLENFIEAKNIKNLIGEVEIHKILEYENLDKDTIEYIVKNNLYIESFDDGSSATELNLNRIAGHKNTPSYILEKIVEKNKTYLSGDSYGQWDVIDALSNPNLNKEFMVKTIKTEIEEIKTFKEQGEDTTYINSKVYGILKNPHCPNNIKEEIQKICGDKLIHDTSGYRMVYDFEQEKLKQERKRENKKNTTQTI